MRCSCPPPAACRATANAEPVTAILFLPPERRRCGRARATALVSPRRTCEYCGLDLFGGLLLLLLFSDDEDDAVECASGHDDFDDEGIELGTGAAAELALDVLDGECAAVRPIGEHGVDGIGDHDDAGGERDVGPGEAVGVSGSVVEFVVVSDAADDLVVEGAEGFEERGAGGGVGLDAEAFGRGEGVGFPDDAGEVGVDLADVVEERGLADGFALAPGEPEVLGDEAGDA